MNYRILGPTGVKVSELCFGTMTFGKFLTVGGVDQRGANQMVAKALEAGVNFFDTADVYAFGQSEMMLAQALKEAKAARDRIFIATKVRGGMSEEVWTGTGDYNNVGLSRYHIMNACEASLKRLGTDHIDLYQVHGWDVLTPMDETMEALDDLVHQGKVRYIGCSNWAAHHMAKSVTRSRREGRATFVSLQAYYSLVGRDLEYDLLPLCNEEGLGIMVWSPLSGGFLSGKYTRKNPQPEGARRTGFDFPPIDRERGFEAIDELVAIARERHATVAQVALAWLLSRKGVTSVIIGAKNMKQLEDNLGAARLKLSEEEAERLSRTTEPRPIYPNWMYSRQNEGRYAGMEGHPAGISEVSRLIIAGARK